jgi:hypothetical protein
MSSLLRAILIFLLSVVMLSWGVHLILYGGSNAEREKTILENMTEAEVKNEDNHEMELSYRRMKKLGWVLVLLWVLIMAAIISDCSGL